MNISDEAVEAAAKAHYEISTNQYMPWEQIDGTYRNATYVFPMRAALEAAALHLIRDAYDAGARTAWKAAESLFKAEAWDEGYAAGTREEQPGWTKNPYRSTK